MTSRRTLRVLGEWLAASPAICALTPILILTGTDIGAASLICSSLAVADYAASRLARCNSERWALGISIMAILLSIAGFVTGLTGSLALALIVICVLSAVALLTHRLWRSTITKPSVSQEALQIKTLHFMLAYSVTLSLMGWLSLYWFSAGLLLAEVLRRIVIARIAKLLSIASVVVGFMMSFRQLQYNGGQFWLSFDQLFRAALAAGLSNWGMYDHIGATGTTLRYHWLGESVAGVVSQLPSVSAIESVTRITPALGALVCLTILIRLGALFRFGSITSLLAASGTIALGKAFEIYSVGSLWGIALFLIGFLVLIELRQSIHEGYGLPLLSTPSVVVLTLLISMSQVTLGIHFSLLTATILGWSALRLRRRRLEILLTVALQLAILGLLNRTLLLADKNHVYAPTISIANILQFRGVDLYLGTYWPYVIGSSLLFLAVISQSLGGLIFATPNSHVDRIALGSFGFVSLVSLFLANAFSIGGPEAQQNRFLVPMITLGLFLSLAMSSRELSRIAKLMSIRVWQWCLAIGISSSVIFAALLFKLYANNLPWSRERTMLIAVSIGLSQILFLTTLTLCAKRSWFSRTWIAQFAVLLVPLIAVTSNADQLGHIYNLQKIGSGAIRAEPFLGDADTQKCLSVARDNSMSESIIASNWYSVPLATRDNKYFLISATLERKTYVDGPNYVANPAPEWLTKRIQTVENFAERTDPASYKELATAGVSLFIVDHSSPVPPSWEPYAQTLFQNSRCTVLRLRPL